MNNGNLKINFNGKNQYIEMSCHEFLDCLSYYISQNKIKTKIFEQLIETKKEFLSQETEKINEFSSGTLYYHLPIQEYHYYSKNACLKRLQDIYNRCPLIEIYLIMNLLGIRDPFFISFLDERKQQLYGGLMNGTNLDLWTKLRIYFDVEGFPRLNLYKFLGITYSKYQSYFLYGKKDMEYYRSLIEDKLDAKLSCFVPEELLIGSAKQKYENYGLYYIEDTMQKLSVKNNVSLYNMRRVLDYAFQLAIDKEDEIDISDKN